MDACEVNPTQGAATFQELHDDMQKDTYWIRFFCRPCCPAPKLDGAIEMLDKLAGEVRANGDFDENEKQQLIELIEARKEWYPKSGLCKG
ncbi:MAG: hypothetical protein V8R08_07515 [Coriobacteriales bacterium]